MAIGGLVLLGIMAALAYFLFPKAITRFLQDPSYTEVIRAQQSEVAAFNRETGIVFSYLTDSWTMKVYRRLDSVVGRGGYEDWIQIVKVERDELISDTLRNVERQRQIADRLALSLESKKAIRDRTKESIFKFRASLITAF